MPHQSQPAALQLILAVGLDGHIRSRIGHASQAIPLTGLVIIQEGLIALVDAALQDLSGTAGAGTGTAGVRQLQALLLSLIQDVHVFGASAVFVLCSLFYALDTHTHTPTHAFCKMSALVACQATFEALSAIRRLEGYLKVCRDSGASWHRVDDGRHVAGGQGTA